MRDSMHRGGPDDAGAFVHPQLPLALGHRRLSFLDLSSAGHQPMRSPDGNLSVIYNGEIYNFREIRKDLEAVGHRFYTQSDTEVILASYRQWGVECFTRFNGMFALALWDETTQEVVLARDHCGIKPLYFHLSKDLFVFASEIRAFKALDYAWEKEEMWQSLFLIFGHLPEPYTTLKNVQMMGKGEWMKISLPSLNVSSGKFYTDDFTPRVTDHESALALVRDILPKAVERHLISDAPVGLFLSGGIDSSLLTLLAAPILKERLNTLSIHFSEAEFSEEAYQRIIINITHSNHSAFQVDQKDFEAALPDILEAMDQPSIDAINTYFISMYAKEKGLKAVLSGLGSDELFGGYPSFSRFNRWKWLNKVPSFISDAFGNTSNQRLSKLSFNNCHPMLSLYLMNRGIFTVNTAASITGTPVADINRALEQITVPPGIDYLSSNSNAAMEQNMYMKHQLLKDADYMAMWHGVEIRVPFLDKELVQAVNSISPSVKFGSSLPKQLLIEAFSTLLPAEIWHRQKQGFTFPFSYWLKQSETLLPNGKKESEVYNQFYKGRLHWSRYWAVKMANIGRF